MSASPTGPSGPLVLLLAIATGTLVANLYYAQPLVASIAPEFGIEPDLAGSVVSVTQIGYGIGLFLLVSLADLVENRKLVLTTMGIATLGLVGAALSTSMAPFFLAAFITGICSTGAQVLLPFAAHMTPPERRGQVLGNVAAGLLAGIMLARPAALFIAAEFGWRAVFWASALLMVAVGGALFAMMPRHQPTDAPSYRQIIASMPGLVRDIPFLRWRAGYQGLMFGSFCMFWTAAPLMLADRFGLSQHEIGLFALTGAGGALCAPIAGWLTDKGLGHPATACAIFLLALCFLGSSWAVAAGMLIALVGLTILLDATIQVSHVNTQRLLFSGPPEMRGRLNALFMTTTFSGGAIGSVLGTASYHWGGWDATAAIGVAAGLVALLMLVIANQRQPASITQSRLDS